MLNAVATRRSLLIGAATLPLIAGCSAIQSASSVVNNLNTSGLIDKATAVVDGIGAIVNPIVSIIGSAGTVAQDVIGAYNDAKSALATIKSNAGSGVAGAVSKIEAGVGVVSGVVTGLLSKLPTSVSLVIADAKMVIGDMKAAVGLPSPPAGPSSVAVDAAVARLHQVALRGP